jgi:hypothetical protein
MVLALALSLVAASLVGRSVGLIRLSRADLKLMQIEDVLSGAQLAAAAAVVRTQQPAPFSWAILTEIGPVDARAEPDKDKLTLAAGAALDDSVFEQLGVSSPAAVRAGLAAAAQSGAMIDVADLDPSALWRACGPRIISAYGAQQTLTYGTAVEPVPGPGPLPQSWRVGEVWRISVTTRDGWRDERWVRFTGDATRPAATVERRIIHGEGDRGRCDSIFQGAS